MICSAREPPAANLANCRFCALAGSAGTHHHADVCIRYRTGGGRAQLSEQDSRELLGGWRGRALNHARRLPAVGNSLKINKTRRSPFLGYAFACGGEPERGLQSLEQAQRLSPRDPFLAIYAPVVRYMALFALQQYEETMALCRSITARIPIMPVPGD